MAMPRAPPSSLNVWDVPAAAPVASGGAEPMIRLLPSTTSGATPAWKTASTSATTAGGVLVPISANTPRPTAMIAAPAAINGPGGRVVASLGTTAIVPTDIATMPGSDHSALARGDRPSTSWKYCETKKNVPNMTNVVSVLALNATLKTRLRNSPRLSSGLPMRPWRTRNTAPTARPPTTSAIGSAPPSPRASRLTP